MTQLTKTLTLFAFLAGACGWIAPQAHAQDTQAHVVVESEAPAPAPAPVVVRQEAPAPAPVVERRSPAYEYETTPDIAYLRNGLWTLSVMYATSVVVAVASDLTADDYLYIPVAGPWLDLTRRDDADSDYEPLYKALLITDGVIQGFATAQIAFSFIFPETRLVERAGTQKRTTFAMRAVPMLSPEHFGVRALGVF